MNSITRGEQVYDRIRADILGGRLEPGARLHFADMVATYGCSIGSLREALQRLATVGLVSSVAQRGSRVVPVSADDLRDLVEARLEIEVAALRHAIRDGDLAWEAEVIAALHVLENTPPLAETDPDQFTDEWATAHNAFHRALLSGCTNRRLRSAALDLRDAAELYRRWSYPRRGRDSMGEHRALCESAVRRDVTEATRLLSQHIHGTTSELRTPPPSVAH